MVFYFTTHDGEYTIYMGKDKYENEDLIKYGLPEDCWFHVDDLSSAHVYLRLKPGQTLDDIPENIVKECATLVKANSIQGCKVRGDSANYHRCTVAGTVHPVITHAVGICSSHDLLVLAVLLVSLFVFVLVMTHTHTHTHR